MNRTQNRPKRRQEKQLSARRKHWYHMQMTDRPSPNAPSLTQAIIVQMVYFVWTLTGLGQALLTKKENNIITTKVSCRELGILLLRRHLILVVKNFSAGARVNQSSLSSKGGVRLRDQKEKFCISPTSTWTALSSINWSASVPKSWEQTFWMVDANDEISMALKFRKREPCVKRVTFCRNRKKLRLLRSKYEVSSNVLGGLFTTPTLKKQCFSSSGQRESPSEHWLLRWVKNEEDRWMQN